MKLAHKQTAIPGVFEVRSQAFTDDRGTFSRFFCLEELAKVWGSRPICQINHTRTHQVGAVRGLHFQRSPQSEAKLVRCLRGRVLDVAVDLRPHSPTFLKWNAVELSPELQNALLVPEGCAHGVQVLEPDSELLYLHSGFYSPSADDGLRCDDPMLAIAWSMPISQLSERDRQHPLLAEADPRQRFSDFRTLALG